MKRSKKAAVVSTLAALERIDRMRMKGKITKAQHDKRSKKVLQKVFVKFT